MQKRLEARRKRYARKQRRQLALLKATKRRGHARKAAQLERVVRRLDQLIAQAKRKPSWRLAWAARFVAPFEGLRTSAYYDSGGVLTIGYGHTGSDVYPGQVISKAKALAYLTSDLRSAAQAVARNVHVPLTVRQRIAAISFTFNVGEGGLQSSSFLRLLNERKYNAAANALLLWVRDADGSVLLGLQRRRRLERRLFLSSTRHQ